MQRDPILVVGTTPDYVARIYENYPQPTIFIIDPRHRDDSRIRDVAKSVLLFNPLENFDDVFGACVPVEIHLGHPACLRQQVLPF